MPRWATDTFYQGRFKSFPIQQDIHLLTVLRYVERNPLRAGLVKRAQDYLWGSCHVRDSRSHPLCLLLSDWPIDRPTDMNRIVNGPQTLAEEQAVRRDIHALARSGTALGLSVTARRLSLQHTLARADAGRMQKSCPWVGNPGKQLDKGLRHL